MILDFFRNVAVVIFMLSLFVVIYLIFCRSYEHFKGIDKELDKYLINAFIYRLYFIIVTITTIGYGDIVPVSMRARLITIAIILTIFILILKVFDSLIESYNNNISNVLNTVNPINLVNNAIKHGKDAGDTINNFIYGEQIENN